MNFPDHKIRGPRSFVSESDIEEKKKKRQEEWEKTRKPDDPLEAPEEVYDPRTLYERLQEQKAKKDAELEEKNKLQNFIPRLDSDEAEYLQAVEKMKEEEELNKLNEERRAIEEYKEAMVNLTADEQEKKLSEFKSLLHNNNKKKSESDSNRSNASGFNKKGSQAALLSGVVKRNTARNSSGGGKGSEGTSGGANPINASGHGEKRKRSEGRDDDNEHGARNSTKKHQQEQPDPPPPSPPSPSSMSARTSSVTSNEGTIKCLGILPGIGVYGSDSSDSEASSNSDVEIERSQEMGFSLIPRVECATVPKHTTREAQK